VTDTAYSGIITDWNPQGTATRVGLSWDTSTLSLIKKEIIFILVNHCLWISIYH